MTKHLVPQTILLCLLFAIILATVATGIYSLIEPASEAVYIPPPRDALAVSADDFNDSVPTLNAGPYSVSLNPDLQVNASGQCPIYFKNSNANTCYLMLDVRLQDTGLLIYRTGLVAPGEGIREIEFVPDALKAMADGSQSAQLTIHSFTLEKYISAGDIDMNTRLTYNP